MQEEIESRVQQCVTYFCRVFVNAVFDGVLQICPLNNYGRTLSDASMLYFADVFYINFLFPP